MERENLVRLVYESSLKNWLVRVLLQENFENLPVDIYNDEQLRNNIKVELFHDEGMTVFTVTTNHPQFRTHLIDFYRRRTNPMREAPNNQIFSVCVVSFEKIIFFATREQTLAIFHWYFGHALPAFLML